MNLRELRKDLREPRWKEKAARVRLLEGEVVRHGLAGRSAFFTSNARTRGVLREELVPIVRVGANSTRAEGPPLRVVGARGPNSRRPVPGRSLGNPTSTREQRRGACGWPGPENHGPSQMSGSSVNRERNALAMEASTGEREAQPTSGRGSRARSTCTSPPNTTGAAMDSRRTRSRRRSTACPCTCPCRPFPRCRHRRPQSHSSLVPVQRPEPEADASVVSRDVAHGRAGDTCRAVHGY